MIISHDISNTTTQLTMIFANLNTTPSFIKQMYTSINTTITTKIKRWCVEQQTLSIDRWYLPCNIHQWKCIMEAYNDIKTWDTWYSCINVEHLYLYRIINVIIILCDVLRWQLCTHTRSSRISKLITKSTRGIIRVD